MQNEIPGMIKKTLLEPRIEKWRKGETQGHNLEKAVSVQITTLASSTVTNSCLFDLVWMSRHMGREATTNVDALSDTSRALDSDCCVSVDFNNHIGSLFVGVELALDVFGDDVYVVSNVIVMFNA